MLKFPCDNCGRIIEDICGEHCLSDDEGQVLEYTCPHCGETIKVASKKIRKIVFLDIDGVLNSEKWAVDFFKQKKHNDYTKYGFDHGIDPKAVELIDKINDAVDGGIELIISSSWRWTMDDTMKRLRTQGLKCPIAGPLTSPPGKDEHEDFICRGMVIYQWLSKQGLSMFNEDDYRYVIIDDDEDMLYSQRHNFIHTSYRDGLTEAGAQRAISILNS